MECAEAKRTSTTVGTRVRGHAEGANSSRKGFRGQKMGYNSSWRGLLGQVFRYVLIRFLLKLG